MPAIAPKMVRSRRFALLRLRLGLTLRLGLLLAQALQFLQHFLRRPGAVAGRRGGGWQRRWLHGRIVDRLFFLFRLRRGTRLCGEGRVAAGGQHDLARRSCIRRANHQKVIAGTVQQGRQDIAWISGTINPKYAGILFEPVHGHARGRFDILQDLRKTGIGRVYRKRSARKGHVGRFGRLIQKGRGKVWNIGRGSRCRRSWCCSWRSGGGRSRLGGRRWRLGSAPMRGDCGYRKRLCPGHGAWGLHHLRLTGNRKNRGSGPGEAA